MMGKFLEVSNHSQFMAEMAKHTLTIKQDDGHYKHLVMAEAGEFENAFEVIAFPHHIMITGDMGTYCFSRTLDMMKWFIKDGDKAIASPQIELHRWYSKLVSTDSYLGAKKKSLTLAKQEVEQNRDFYINEYPDQASIINSAFDDLIDYAEMGVEMLLIEMYGFSFTIDGNEHQPFTDFEADTVEAYVSQFAWCCYAINFAIGEYLQTQS